MTVIAMTREMGTRGKEVAALVAERLGSSLVYHELVNDPPDPVDLSGPSEVERHLGNGHDSGRASGRMTPLELLELAAHGNVIIRGWGAVRLLHAIPHVLCLRVCAPMEARIAEMARRLGVPERAARREIERNDASHTGLFQRFFGGDWRDATDYDVVLSTARMTPEQCADIVVDLVARETFRETEESRQILADRLAEARVAAWLANDPVAKASARNVYVSASGGAITLYGCVRGEGTARELAEGVQAHTGMAVIRNELQALGRFSNA